MTCHSDRRHGAHPVTEARALKPIHDKILLTVKLLDSAGHGCTAGEVLDLLTLGGEQRSGGSLSQQLKYLVSRGLIRRISYGRYAMPEIRAEKANTTPVFSSSIPPISKAKLMAGRAR